jgi:histidinol phosphatase-like enzyme
VPEALRRLKRAGFGVFLISNQSGIGRAVITEQQIAETRLSTN